MIKHVRKLKTLKKKDGLAKNAKDILDFLHETGALDKEKNDLMEYFEEVFENAGQQEKEDFHRAIDTISWAVEPFQRSGMIDAVKLDKLFQKITKDLEDKTKWSTLKAEGTETEVTKWFDNLNFPEQRELLGRLYPIIPFPGNGQYESTQGLVKDNKPVRGALAKQHFILNSGKTHKDSIEARRKWANEKMGAVFGLQKEFGHFQNRAEKLLGALVAAHKDDGASDSDIGPVKLLEGIMLKADRKFLGKDKESDYDWLPYQKKAMNDVGWENSIIMDIKDIIRGTMIFKSFDKMTVCLAKMTKTFLDASQEFTADHAIVGISKVSNGFTGKEANSTSTYRDMKIVVNLKITNKDHKNKLMKLLDDHDAKVDFVPFEIQLNTESGITIKNAGTGLHSDWYYLANPKATKVGKDYYVKKGHMFNSDKFVADCFEEVKLKNAKVANSVKAEYKTKMSVLTEDDDLEDDCWSGVEQGNAIKKAHSVYKMPGGVNKKACEAVYNKIYEIGFWKDGYHPGRPDQGYQGTHCKEFKTALDILVKGLNYLPKGTKERQIKIDKLESDKSENYMKDIADLKREITELENEARRKLAEFLNIVGDGSKAPYDHKKGELAKFAKPAPVVPQSVTKSINIDARLRMARSKKAGVAKNYSSASSATVGDYSKFAKRQSSIMPSRRITMINRIVTRESIEEETWC